MHGKSRFTIGYQGASLSQLLDSLEAARVTLVVDTRESPTSRRAEFRSGPLAQALSARGIRYASLPQLGAPKDLRDQVGIWHEFARGYRTHLKTQQLGVAQLSDWARTERLCLLCFEDDPAACHRSLLIEELEGELGGATWLHLRPGRVDKTDDGKGVRVRLHSPDD